MPAKEYSAQWPAGDPSSFARPESAVVTGVHLSLRVDFERHVLAGSADLTVERRDPAATHVVLDTRQLDVAAATDLATGAALDWSLGADGGPLGQPLTVQLPADATSIQLRIQYQTTAGCTALAWLEPAQTAGRRHPYVFSQNQAIHCRSMAPLQDTPAVKFPYTAEITVPSPLTALMSGLRDWQRPAAADTDGSGATVFRFRQPVPMPAYLIALAVGELESRRLGPRCAVWSEPAVVEAAAAEFEDTEAMLETAESICGPYVWGVYDLLVLPPSFPFGGMENPCLTFVTPTLLAGDKSLADVVAHEITHSWTGNLVTNRNWEHFWLNEGWTKFVERKIVARLHGEPSRHLSAIDGWKSLREEVQRRGEKDPLTSLVVRLEGLDPDDAFSSIPYEKGHTFLWYLEQLVGGPAEFEPFIKAYVARYQYKTLDTEDFRRFLLEFFVSKASALEAVDWETWFSAPGMPPYTPSFDTSLADACSALAQRWLAWDVSQPCPLSADDVRPLSSCQLVVFLGQLLEAPPLPLEKLRQMEGLYGMNARRNAEVRFRWLRLCITSRWRQQVPAALEMATTQGRMKFVRPLFRDLYGWEEVRPEAVQTFLDHRKYMMYVCASQVAKDLKLEE